MTALLTETVAKGILCLCLALFVLIAVIQKGGLIGNLGPHSPTNIS